MRTSPLRRSPKFAFNEFSEDVPEGMLPSFSVRCQPQDVLLVLLADDGEAAFLQNPDGGDVVLLHGEGCRESGQSGAAVVVNAGASKHRLTPTFRWRTLPVL